MFSSQNSQVSSAANYIEDVFSTYLYTGNGSTQFINNGINLGLTPTDGTVLQMTGDNTSDSSPSAKTVTAVNGATTNSSIKKYGTASLSLNGTNQYFYSISPADFAVTTEDFTVEAWVYCTNTTGARGVLSTRIDATGNNNQFFFGVEDGQVRYYGGSGLGIFGGTVNTNTWYFIAASRQSGTVNLFLDGVLVNTVTDTSSKTTAYCYVGSGNGGSGQYFAGYIDDARFTKGKARYTANFSVPTAALPIDTSIAGKGGLVWIKDRTQAYDGHLIDTARGGGYYLVPSSTDAQGNQTGAPTSFNSNGFTEQDQTVTGDNYVSWTFRKQPKFFDVVTFTGDGTTNRSISHSLGSVPGAIWIKRTDSTGNWAMYQKVSGYPGGYTYFSINTTDAPGNFIDVPATSTTFEPYKVQSATGNTSNINGATYVAYLFADNAGGFGLTGTDNVISCGSWTDSGSGTQTITLGYEPQWLMYKRSDDISNWVIVDNMRAWPVVSAAGSTANLYPNLSNAESGGNYGGNGPTATGFNMPTLGGGTYIYIAIRRGPMKVPTSGTSVFYPTTYTGTGSARTFSGFGFPPDMELSITRGSGDGNGPEIYDKLRGPRVRLLTSQSDAEFTTTESVTMLQDGISVGATSQSYINFNGYEKVLYALKRAPSFFDEVCYSGTGSNTTQAHNLGVAPELMILKQRSGGGQDWPVYASALGASNVLVLNSTAASTSLGTVFNSTAPTSTVFSLGTNNSSNSSGINYVAYLFATTAGVSKVGSFTGNGSSQTINCGFTGGARFVLIKKTSGTGDWMVSDSARGIVSGSDPYLELNNTNAEVTGEDWLDTDSTGFVVNEVSGSNANTNGATYIFLAIA